MKTYPDLHELLRHEKEACEFFDSLPMYVRSAINDRPDGVNSLSSLKSYADNLTRGNL